jgi:hypothetical protein
MLRTQDAPRATSVAEASQFIPVQMREPTILGNDPYQTVKPKVKDQQQATQTAKVDWTLAPRALLVDKPEPEIRRAKPVGPLDRQQPALSVDLPTPSPVDLNNDPTDF